MRYLVTFLLFFLTVIAYSQDFKRVDSFVSTVKPDNSLPLDELIEKISKPFSTDIDKTRAFFYWIADNIEYDYENFKNRTVSSEQVKPETVYHKRVAVCEGYSNLFKYMLDYCDIENEVISGYARCDLETIFVKESNHAWNSVKLNNKWYLFDVTWARDTLNNKVNDFYFQTNPETFILNHYPLDYEWSLLKTKYSLDDYMKFPIYSNLYYELRFTDKISKIGYYKAINDTVLINLKPRFECLLLTTLYDLEKKEWIKNQTGQFLQRKDFFKLYIPRKGKFILKLGAIKQEDGNLMIYDSIIYYVIDNK